MKKVGSKEEKMWRLHFRSSQSKCSQVVAWASFVIGCLYFHLFSRQQAPTTVSLQEREGNITVRC